MWAFFKSESWSEKCTFEFVWCCGFQKGLNIFHFSVGRRNYTARPFKGKTAEHYPPVTFFSYFSRRFKFTFRLSAQLTNVFFELRTFSLKNAERPRYYFCYMCAQLTLCRSKTSTLEIQWSAEKKPRNTLQIRAAYLRSAFLRHLSVMSVWLFRFWTLDPGNERVSVVRAQYYPPCYGGSTGGSTWLRIFRHFWCYSRIFKQF